MFTREEYLIASRLIASHENRLAAHRQYYAQFVNERTIAFVVNWIGKDKLKASTDPYMNDIPLNRWDSMVNMLPLAIRSETVGDYYTLGNCVCIAKEAARQYLESLKG